MHKEKLSSTSFKCLFKFIFIININSKYRPEYFFAHGYIFRICCFNDRWLNKIAFCFITLTSYPYLCSSVSFFALSIYPSRFIKTFFINHCIYEIGEIFHRSHLHGLTPALPVSSLLLLQYLMEYMPLMQQNIFVPGIQMHLLPMLQPPHLDLHFYEQSQNPFRLFLQQCADKICTYAIFLPIVSHILLNTPVATCKMYAGKITVIKTQLHQSLVHQYKPD